MPDIANFWSAFKFSWLRRLLNTRAFWPSILLQEISTILNNNISVSDLVQLGVAKLNDISKKIKNNFWKQVLISTVSVVDGFVFYRPEKFLNSSFWYNPLIKRNTIVKYNHFPEISNKITSVAEFFYHGTNEIMQYGHFCQRYGVDISEEKFVDIRYCIMLALQKLKLPRARLCEVQYPQKPVLIDIALSTKKGCSFYSKLLAKKGILGNKIVQREEKWHNELNLTLSIDFWMRARKFCTKIDFDNQLRWLQFQIVRNSLQTNYIVSHFRPNISKLCTFCQDAGSLELISHLFWLCPRIKDFIRTVIDHISTLGLTFTPTKLEFLFGYQNIHPYSPKNLICLVLKKYIWKAKFRNGILTLVSFLSLLKSYLYDIKYMFECRKKFDDFNEWITIFDAL